MQKSLLLRAMDVATFVAIDQSDEVAPAVSHIGEDGGLLIEGEFLREVAGDQAVPSCHDPAVRLFFAGEDFEKGTLS